MTEETPVARRRQRLEAAFAEEELAGLRLIVRARLVALAVVAVWLFIWVQAPRVYYLEAILVLFAGLGVAYFYLRLARVFESWIDYLFVAADFALLAFATIGLDLILDDPWPPQMALRNGTIVYFFLFIAVLALGYAPRLVIWAGAVAALAWSARIWMLVREPDTVTPWTLGELSDEARLAAHLDPRFVDTNVWQQDVILLLLVAGILALAVWRSRSMVMRQAESERQRSNLARYFSPNVVERLARRDRPLGEVRSQPVVVLFADIVGFTHVSEALPAERVIELLREFHGRMSRCVFEQDGTVDKYIGDAIMATFGTPLGGPDDGSRALACARAMVASVAEWNRERWAEGFSPIQIGIGLHYGPAVLGDIGGERRLEFTVVGDTVNVASRLEGLTRTLGVDVAISDELADRVEEEGREDLLDGFAKGQPQQLKNREAPLVVWIWRAA